MKHERFEMCLIIPFQYDNSHYETIGTDEEVELQEYFVVKAVRFDRIDPREIALLESSNNGFMKCLELKQKYRRKLGLHQNENCTYTFGGDFTFQITKVKGWFLPDGNVYLMLHIKAADLMEDQVLDLKSFLVNIKEHKKIAYASKQEFMVRNLIKEYISLLASVGATEQRETYQTAQCLSYGIVEEAGDEEIRTFTENLRQNKRRTNKISKAIDEKSLFIPKEFQYLYWAVSQQSLCLTADLTQAKKRSDANDAFLHGNMGASVFTNYLMLYIYYSGLQEQCADLEMQCRMAAKGMGRYPKRSRVLELKEDVRGISNESFINELFCGYLCENIWNMSERIRKTEEIVKNNLEDEREREIFISYRRLYGAYPARLVYDKLTDAGMTVFYDRKSMGIGNFKDQIRRAIEGGVYVVVILTPGCLDPRPEGKDDVMKDELLLAMELMKQTEKTDLKKKIDIIPMFVDEFQFPADLPDELKELPAQHGPKMSADNIDAALDELLGLLRKS